MSRDPDDPSTSTSSPNSQSIFADALKQYKKRTKKDIAAHSLAAQIESCGSPNAVLTVLQTQVQTFDPSPSANERWTTLLGPTITVLYAFSGFVSNVAGPVFPPAAAIFTGIGVLLQVVKDVRATEDILIDLFDRIKYLFMRLEKYIAVRPMAAMTDVIVQIMVEVISILGIATKEIGQGRLNEYVKKLFRIHRVEDAFQRLDKLTQEGARMAEVEILTIAARNDENLIHVGENVEGVNEGMGRVHQSRKALRQWIDTPNWSSNFYDASDVHHEGTAAWCIEGETFADWMASGSLLWIHGKPGSGKTILSSVIIREIKSMANSGSSFLAYFYFDFKDEGKKDSRALLSSLLEQLSDQSDRLCDVLRGLYSEHQGGSKRLHDDVLFRCLKDMLTIARYVPIYVVIDALNECPNDSDQRSSQSPRGKVLSLVKDLVELRLPNLHLCVTSRPEFDIRTFLKPLAAQEISLDHEIGQNRDINVYITFVVQSVKHWRGDDKQMVIDKLTEDADGMFRWVYCKLEVLRQCHRNDLRRILKELPQSLDEMYWRILKEINNENQKQAHRFLQCLAVAQRPLRVEELAEVLALDADPRGTPSLNVNLRWEDHEAAVLSTCSSLVSIVNQDGFKAVQFCHSSAKEFLTSDRISSMEDISQFHISHESSHVILAQACLGVLLRMDEPTSEDRAESVRLGQYTSEYWIRHAQVGNVEFQIKDALDRLFDPDGPHFAAFFRRAPAPFRLLFSRAPSDRELKGVLSPAAPFYFAAMSGLSGLAERLILAKKAQVINFCGHKGTLLHLAVHEGHIEAVRLLLAHGADINSRKDYATPSHIASPHRYSQGLETHLEKPLDSGLDAIGTWPQDSDVNVRSEESGDADTGARKESGFTPLHFAASEGHLDICHMLLEHNADVRVHDDSGDTPLHLAASGHHLEIARILLKYNAGVDSRNEDGSTPLLVALSSGNPDISSLLLAHNADAFVCDNKGSTPLHLAAIGGHLEVARMLLELKVEVDSRNDDGFTPLLLTSSKGNLGMLRLLLAYNANVLVHDNSGNTPLHLATIGGQLEIARMLLEFKVEVNSLNDDGLTPLQRVSRGRRKGYRDIMRLLLDHGANMNVHDKRRNTSLHFAASQGVLKVTPDTTSNFHQSRKTLRQWIDPPDPSSNFYTASDAHHEGTTAWCIEGETFADWMTSGSLLWIHGKPGSGKTILSSVIIRDIEFLSDFGSVFLAYFYFDFKDEGKKDSRALLSSLLDQLSNQSDQFRDVLRVLYSEHQEGSKKPHDDALVWCLKGMLTSARSVPIYLVIDALDECPNDSGDLPSRSPRRKVLGVVEELDNLCLPNLRLCITSRPELDIRTFLGPLAIREISLDNESGPNRDINAYVTFVVQSVKRWRDDDKKMVINKLTEDADGMFRWVYCQLEVLLPCFPNQLRRMVEEFKLPKSLDETYKRILKEINNANQKQAHQLLQCLAVAYRPLRVEELAEVLALDVDAGGIPRFNANWRWEDHEAAVLSACSSLVSVVNHDGSRVVQFCHFSAKQFLTSDRLASIEDISQFHISHEPSHVILAQACLGVLLSIDNPTSADDIPLLEYASEYWVQHAQVGKVELRIKDALDRFFDLDNPHFAAFFQRACTPSNLRFFRAPSDGGSNGVLSPAAPFYFAAISGLSGLAERLIVAKKPQVINFCGYKGTLLHLAVREGHIEAVRLLLAHGADINSRNDYATPPHIVSGIASPHIHSQGLENHLESLLDSGLEATDATENGPQDSDVDVSSEESGFTPLHFAASEGHLDICQMLLEFNADVRVYDKHGNTPLHVAVLNGHVDICRILVKQNVEINSQNHHGSTPLLIASEHETPDLVRLLLDHNSDMHVSDANGDTPLHRAAIAGRLEVARSLLAVKVEVNSRNNVGLTPLHLASAGYKAGNSDFVRLLLDHGADAQAQTLIGETASEVARGLHKQEILQLLSQHVVG